MAGGRHSDEQAYPSTMVNGIARALLNIARRAQHLAVTPVVLSSSRKRYDMIEGELRLHSTQGAPAFLQFRQRCDVFLRDTAARGIPDSLSSDSALCRDDFWVLLTTLFVSVALTLTIFVSPAFLRDQGFFWIGQPPLFRSLIVPVLIFLIAGAALRFGLFGISGPLSSHIFTVSSSNLFSVSRDGCRVNGLYPFRVVGSPCVSRCFSPFWVGLSPRLRGRSCLFPVSRAVRRLIRSLFVVSFHGGMIVGLT
jgi:hypothetical protein